MLNKCKQCFRYTLAEKCPNCAVQTSPAHPLKYSKEDKYASYRRMEKFAKNI